MMQDTWLVANFSDGSKLTYGDPNRASLDNLRAHLKDSGLGLANLSLQFYDHVEQATPDNPKGVYFSRSAECTMDGSGENLHSYVVGWIEGDVLKIVKWKVPEILPFFSEDREIPVN